MKTRLTKKVNLRLEPGDLLRFFRILEYVDYADDIMDMVVKSDAALLLEELREIRDIVKSEAPRDLKVTFDVEAFYERSSDSITLGDIFVPGEPLPEVAEEVYETALPLIEIDREEMTEAELIDKAAKTREEMNEMAEWYEHRFGQKLFNPWDKE